MGINAIRGFNDILPQDSIIWRHIEEIAFSLFSTYGFSEIRTPIAEKTELFARSIGETTDIVEKEMYTFPDRHGEGLTLRPEGTAPVVRAYIEHKMYVNPVTRLCYTGPMFRYERPQKGRYRQFYQIGAEVLGEPSPRADAETLEMLMRLFTLLKVKGAKLQVNSLGCRECRPAYKETLLGFLKGKEGLCENCIRRMGANPLRVLDCKVPGCIEATKGAPSIIESLCPDCKAHFEEVLSTLKAFGVEASVNPRMVRGLDYYTKTTFEITAEGLGSQNAVAAGGRYDGLVAELGGPETPCFGFAMGVERIALLIKDEWKGLQKPLIALITLGEAARSKGMELASQLREGGLRVIEEFSAGQLKSRMKRVDRMGARFALIIGEDELKEGVAAVKDMQAATQEKVSFEAIFSNLAAKIQ